MSTKTQKTWKVLPKVPKKILDRFPELNPTLVQLLYNRKITTQKGVDHFLLPDFGQDLYDPLLLPDIKKVIREIFKFIKEKKKIVVFGDYDVDGVTASVVLSETLKRLGAKVSVYIPDRIKEGYGLNEKVIKGLEKNGTDLIITVDLGVTDFKEIELANKIGMKIIVTDHHHCRKKLPKALAIINPKRKDSKYPFKELTGVGIAFKLSQALIRAASDSKFASKLKAKKPLNIPKVDISQGREKWFLDLVALGTVCDCAPIISENRVFVKYGLKVLEKTQRLGLRELMNLAGIRVEDKVRKISKADELRSSLSTYTLGFQIGPRLNAAGRMDHANSAYYLLNIKREDKVRPLARKLNILNVNRQDLVNKIIGEAKAKLGLTKKAKRIPKILIAYDENWPSGICGLVAGKIMEEYSRPVLIFEKRGDILTGSARSIPTFHITKALEKLSNLLLEFGGHSQAAGMDIRQKNFEEFKKKITKIANKKIKPQDLKEVLKIEKEVEEKSLNIELFDDVARLEPFGEGNPEPKFLIKNVEIVNLRRVGRAENHLKMEIKKNSRYFKAIGFNMVEKCASLRIGKRIDLVFNLICDEWNGARGLELRMVDFVVR